MAISIIFQKRFVELVDETEMNKTALAENMKVNYETFTKAYTYGILPRAKLLVQIADYFEVSVDYLIGNIDENCYRKANARSNFAERLESLRKENNIKTVYELAKRVHIHRNNISQWLKYDYIPNLDDLQLLADFFDVSLDYLLGRTDEKRY